MRLVVAAGVVLGLTVMVGLIAALARQADCQLAHLDWWA